MSTTLDDIYYQLYILEEALSVQTEQLTYLKIQLDYLNETTSILTTYMLYQLVIVILLACFMAVSLGIKVSRGK